MLQELKKLAIRILLRRKQIILDSQSSMNYRVQHDATGKESRIISSHVQIERMGRGCFLEHVYCYGHIQLGHYVSISGPGTILHAEVGNISIGSFSSIAANVSIQEFSHRMERPTTSAVNHMIYMEEEKDDFVSKGDILIEEDVWIGSNAVILSGVTVGRGSIVAAGAVVNKDVPRYAVVAGCPAKVVKQRFTPAQQNRLEEMQWWLWDDKQLSANKQFLKSPLP